MKYQTPSTSKEAAVLMGSERGQAFVLAGGTDLMVRMKGRFVQPDLLVDINISQPCSRSENQRQAFELALRSLLLKWVKTLH